MVSEWKPGDVALIRVGTGDYELGLRQDNGGWACEHADPRRLFEDVTVSRPLVVIDPEDREQVERLAAGAACTRQQMEYALREFANPTPPKPPEPQGLGAVVEDADGTRWVRAYGTPMAWTNGVSRLDSFADIAAVKVLSEGVTP